jgi:DNA polymerase II small subunit/DNA polymerase delta subunit B
LRHHKLVPFAGKCFFASSFNKRYLKIRSPPHYFCLQNPKMNNMTGVVEEAGTANLSEAPEFTQFL